MPEAGDARSRRCQEQEMPGAGDARSRRCQEQEMPGAGDARSRRCQEQTCNAGVGADIVCRNSKHPLRHLRGAPLPLYIIAHDWTPPGCAARTQGVRVPVSLCLHPSVSPSVPPLLWLSQALSCSLALSLPSSLTPSLFSLRSLLSLPPFFLSLIHI